jgi:miniconductance mechanosensitive channel
VKQNIQQAIKDLQSWLGETTTYDSFVGILAVLLLAGLLYVLLRLCVSIGCRRLVKRTSVGWDNALYEAGVLQRLALIIPVLVFWQGLNLIPNLSESVLSLLSRLTSAAGIVVGVGIVSSVLVAVGLIYRENAGVNRYSIKSYLQVARMAAIAVGLILIVAVLMDRSPMVFLGGLGAMTAVLVLAFKDTLMGFVASVQIAGNDMVRVGDWIEMPSAGADGDVLDIALHTMKVQNWDMTITTIPTYMLIQESFRNWRGMSDSGGRRIKRSLWFDVNTIRFLTEEEIEGFASYALLRSYVEGKLPELARYNNQPGLDPEIKADTRRLTNIGTLRAYIESYLKQHAMIHNDMTLLVRQLQPTSEGLPIEIYCFTNTTKWNEYESIQADIFDHILALIPEFGLRIYQQESDFGQTKAKAKALGGHSPQG